MASNLCGGASLVRHSEEGLRFMHGRPSGKHGHHMATGFRDLMRAEEAVLRARLDAVRAALDHAGEKGRVLESATKALIRSWLPHEYGVGTGFIARFDPKKKAVELSGQLDIIIYDALRCAPLARFDTCEVYPLEAIFGYVEVKTQLRSSMEGIAKQAATLRRWEDRFFISYEGESGSNRPTKWSPIHAFAFAYEWDKGKAVPADVGGRVGSALAEVGPPASLSSVFVDGTALRSQRPLKPTPGEHLMNSSPEHGLAVFKWRMLMDLTAFPRMPLHCVPELAIEPPVTGDTGTIRS